MFRNRCVLSARHNNDKTFFERLAESSKDKGCLSVFQFLQNSLTNLSVVESISIIILSAHLIAVLTRDSIWSAIYAEDID